MKASQADGKKPVQGFPCRDVRGAKASARAGPQHARVGGTFHCADGPRRLPFSLDPFWTDGFLLRCGTLFALEPALEETLMTFTLGYSSLDDQVLAGVIMWVPGSFPLLIPILRLIVELSTSRVEIVRTHG
jgi:hypothetical protein